MNIGFYSAFALLFSFVPARADIIWGGLWDDRLRTIPSCLWMYVAFIVMAVIAQALVVRFFAPYISFIKSFVISCVLSLCANIGAWAGFFLLLLMGFGPLFPFIGGPAGTSVTVITVMVLFLMSVFFKLLVLSVALPRETMTTILKTALFGTVAVYGLAGIYWLISSHMCVWPMQPASVFV